MAYCPRCGVQVEDRLDRCPLCDTAIPQEVRGDHTEPTYPDDIVPPKAMYRPLTKRQKRRLFRGIVAFFALFPIALTVLLDLYLNGAVTWSYYVVVPVTATAIVGSLFYRFGRRPLISVNGTLVVLVGVLALLNPPGIMRAFMPYVLLVAAATEILLVYIAARRPSGWGAIIASTIVLAFFLVGIDITVWLQISAESVGAGGGAGSGAVGSGTVGSVLHGAAAWFDASYGGWSLIVAAVLLPIAIYTGYLRFNRRRGLNVAGFFFLDLTVMLLGIDLADGGGVGWSAVNALVFVPIAIIFYALHIALFNDTDWRKALHL
jgi:hypothetical protein